MSRLVVLNCKTINQTRYALNSRMLIFFKYLNDTFKFNLLNLSRLRLLGSKPRDQRPVLGVGESCLRFNLTCESGFSPLKPTLYRHYGYRGAQLRSEFPSARLQTRNIRPATSFANPQQQLSSMELAAFNEVFPEIVANLTKDYLNTEVQQAALWYKQVIQYNVFDGKKTRGTSVSKCLKQMMGLDKLTEERIHLAHIVGWCVELLQAFFLIADDVMDQSSTRRGKPCWYKKDGVGLQAINDALSLEAGIYTLLKKYFRNETYYVHLVELFHETTMQTIFGQSLDAMLSANGEVDLDQFTPPNYAAIVKYKTAFYSFYLPVAIGMYMAGLLDEQLHLRAKPVLLEIGHLFQVQDDYIDCFGDPAVTGKHGTDIEDGKCSWLVVEALKRVTPLQKQILQDNYGRHDIECIARVKELYETLRLPETYSDYEEHRYKHIMDLIGQFEDDLPKDIFYDLIKGIYKRQR